MVENVLHESGPVDGIFQAVSNRGRSSRRSTSLRRPRTPRLRSLRKFLLRSIGARFLFLREQTPADDFVAQWSCPPGKWVLSLAGQTRTQWSCPPGKWVLSLAGRPELNRAVPPTKGVLSLVGGLGRCPGQSERRRRISAVLGIPIHAEMLIRPQLRACMNDRNVVAWWQVPVDVSSCVSRASPRDRGAETVLPRRCSCARSWR
jgi:hypothetical protein